MEKAFIDDHYEEKFKFPLMAAIEKYAQENDCSYLRAAKAATAEYAAELDMRNDALAAELDAQQTAELKAFWGDELYPKKKK